LECNSIEIAEKEFEEVEINENDEDEIKKLSNDPMIYRKITIPLPRQSLAAKT